MSDVEKNDIVRARLSNMVSYFKTKPHEDGDEVTAKGLLRYYKLIIDVPSSSGISFREEKDGTYVVYRRKKRQGAKGAGKAEDDGTVIGKTLKHDRARMYPNENYARFFKSPKLSDGDLFRRMYFLEQAGRTAFLHLLAEKSGLWDDLKECFGVKASNALLDLAFYLVYYRRMRDKSWPLDRYINNPDIYVPMLTDEYCTADSLMEDARKVQDSDIRRFVKMWADRQMKEDSAVAAAESTASEGNATASAASDPAAISADAGSKRICLHTDATYIERIDNSWVSPGYFNLYRCEGPDGNLTEQNFVMAIRLKDGMPLFYRDFGYDESLDIYEEGMKLCREFGVSDGDVSFALKPSEVDYGYEVAMSGRYDYFYSNYSVDETIDETLNEMRRAKEIIENGGGQLIPNTKDTYCVSIPAAYENKPEGYVFAYCSASSREEELEKALKRLEWRKEQRAAAGRRAEDSDTENSSADSGSTEDSDAENADEEDFDVEFAGYRSFFSTTGDEVLYAPEFMERIYDLCEIIESAALHEREDRCGCDMRYDRNKVEQSEEQYKAEKEMWDKIWDRHNNEVESLVKFLACLLWQMTDKAMKEDCSYDPSGMETDTPLNVLWILHGMDIFCTRDGRVFMEYLWHDHEDKDPYYQDDTATGYLTSVDSAALISDEEAANDTYEATEEDLQAYIDNDKYFYIHYKDEGRVFHAIHVTQRELENEMRKLAKRFFGRLMQ